MNDEKEKYRVYEKAKEAGDIQDSAMYKQAISDGAVPDGYQKVSVKFFRFEKVGDYIEGHLMRKDTTVVKGNKVGKYTLLDKEGNRITFNGSVRIDELMQAVAQGGEILLRYSGNEMIDDDKDMKIFELYVKKR